MNFRNDLPAVPVDPKLLLMADALTDFLPSVADLHALRDLEPTPLFHDKLLGTNLDLVDTDVFLPPKDGDECEIDPLDAELLVSGSRSGLAIAKKPPVTTPPVRAPSFPPPPELLLPLNSKRPAQLSATELADSIEKSFVTARLPPVHASNPTLKPVHVWPLYPDKQHWNAGVEAVDLSLELAALLPRDSEINLEDLIALCIVDQLPPPSDTPLRTLSEVRLCLPAVVIQHFHNGTPITAHELREPDLPYEPFRTLLFNDEPTINEYFIRIHDNQARYTPIEKRSKLSKTKKVSTDVLSRTRFRIHERPFTSQEDAARTSHIFDGAEDD
jgi:hypothetical protein